MQVSTLCTVFGVVAHTLVHRVVVHQSHLIACQQFVAIHVEQYHIHCAVPDTALQHATGVERALAGIHLVGGAIDERTVTCVIDAVQRCLQGVCIQVQLMLLVIQHHCYALETVEGQCGLAFHYLVVNHSTQGLVLRQPQLQLFTVATV